ncbi:fibrinogen-like protein 1 [Alosa sapidissima]|uniref:fibrinogen-like protein 1 n=1 Tax=Alosa sapidissima TaxID=34773 RepID=UPI001C08753F|nr:fibrinogen-like protein 1 [Alosa sapidissima]
MVHPDKMRTLWTSMFHFIFIANLLIFKNSLSAPVQQHQVPVPASCQDEVHWLQSQLLQMKEYIQQLQDQLSQTSTGHQRIPDVLQKQIVQPQTGSVPEYTDCSQVFEDGNLVSGVYMIKPKQSPTSVMVFCDMSDGGGWTVFQRRKDGQESFDRTWVEYKHGFGNLLSNDGEFWLGNDPLHYLTSQGNYKLKIKMEDFDGIPRFAEYKNVKVGDEKDEYELQVGDYKGNAGDALVDAHPHPERPQSDDHQGLNFSTYDHNSHEEDPQCIHQDKSGWWFSRCHSGNLNGHYYNGPYQAVTDDGVVWYTWHGYWYSIKSVVMMIRPEGFEESKAEHEPN